MRYVVFSFDGYGLPIAQQLQREGHDVTVAMVQDQSDVLSKLEVNIPDEEPEAKQRRLSLYDGMLEKRPAWEVVEELERTMPEDTVLFFDLNQLFRFSERLRPLGLPGNYPTEADFLLEIDREAAKRFVAKNYPNVRVGENKRFSKAADCIQFLKDSDDIWVLKGLEEDARTIVPDVDDVDLARGQIVEALKTSKKEYESAGFILERMIPGMLEFTPQRVYYDGAHIATMMVLENKELGAGDVGPMTDCAQDLCFLIEEDDKIAEIAFPPIVDKMARMHQGIFLWDASLLIEARTGKIYFGEFCANRPGYNALYNQMSLVGSSSEYFEEIIKERNPFPDNEVGVAVRLFNLNEDGGGLPQANAAIDYKPRAERDLWLTDVRRVRGRLRSAGYKDTIGVATGAGKSVYEAARRAHRTIDEFSFEGAFYRPMFDMLSREYKTSILNRIDYGLRRSFYKVGFGIV